ncbi:hypothetical protein ACOSQ2_014995 [Xanthoceras sorbifolium]
MTRGWSETHLIGMFTEGLKSRLAREVKLRQPRNLREVMRMAEIFEGSYKERKTFEGHQESKTYEEDKTEVSSKTKGKTTEVRKLSREEMQEHVKKGLCFKCSEKWARDHHARMAIC